MVKKAYLLLIFILAAFQARSQCTQSLGTPIVNETFGAGAAPVGPPLAAGITNLPYTNAECPETQGQYSIVNYTTGCYNNAWLTVTDHTDPGNGYFMLVNASLQPSDFFVQTVNGLCDGTTYQFGAWLVNVFNSGGVLPDVTFSIEKTDGTILQTYDTGPIATLAVAKWLPYSFFFTMPVGVTSVVIRMHNNAPGGVGNDLGLDDITFTPAGPQTTIGITGFTGTTLNNPCYQNISFYSSVAACYVANGYQWQTSTDAVNWTDIPGATNASYAPALTVAGTYYYRMNVAQSGNIGNVSCRVNSNMLTIVYQPLQPPFSQNITAQICPGNSYLLPSGKMVDSTGLYSDTVRYKQGGCDSLVTSLNLTVYNKPHLGPPKGLCFGDTVLLSPGTFISYLWQDGSTKPTYNVTNAGTYWVRVSYPTGCTVADTMVVKLIGCLPAKIPNTFTPNGDGVNDTWLIDGLQGYTNCVVYIYNRWGQLVFKSTGYSKPWDGRYNNKNVPFGTYYYVIDLKNNTRPISGNVTIIR